MKTFIFNSLKNIFIVIFIVAILLHSLVLVARAEGTKKSVRELIQSGLRYYDPNECKIESSGSDVPPGTLPSTVPEPYNGIFTKAAQQFKIPPALLAAIYLVEHSSYMVDTREGRTIDPATFKFADPPPPYGTGETPEDWGSSSANAKGPFQFLDSTWGVGKPYSGPDGDPQVQGYQVDGNGDGKQESSDLTDGAFGAAKYMSFLYKDAGEDPAKAGAGYNSGNINSQHPDALAYGKATKIVYDYYGGGSPDEARAPTPSPSPGPSPTPSATPTPTPSPSSVTNFNPDPAAVEEYNKTIKPKMQEFVDIYKNAAKAEKVADWELLGAFHWMEHGLNRGTEVGGGGYITSFQLDRNQILNKLAEIEDIMGGQNPDDPLFSTSRTDPYTDEEVTKAARISLRLWHKVNAKELNIDLSKSLSLEQLGELAIRYKSGGAWESLDKNLHAYTWAGVDASPEHKLPMTWGPGSPFAESGQEVRPGVAVVFGLTKNGAFGSSTQGNSCSCSDSNAPSNGMTVFLDPGHGPTTPEGERIDPASGLLDSEWLNEDEAKDAWEIAQNAKKELEQKGYKIVLSKDSVADKVEYFRDKAEKANTSGAAIGVSIHTTGGPDFVWEQFVGAERHYNGSQLTFTNQAIADKSAEFAKIFVETRKNVERLNDIITTPHDYNVPGKSQGNLSLIALFADKVPWVYLEKGTGGDGSTNRPLTPEEKEDYKKSIVESIIKALPPQGQNAPTPAPSDAPAQTPSATPTPTASVSTSSSDSTSGCAPAGDPGGMMELVKQYAWEDGRRGLEKTPAYATITAERAAKGLYLGAMQGIDCGGFVATVVDTSKVDPEKPYIGQTQVALQYMTENTAKYQKLTVASTNDLQPGDIGVHSGHIYMHTGKLTANWKGDGAEASLNKVAPTAMNTYLSDSRGAYQWFRILK